MLTTALTIDTAITYYEVAYIVIVSKTELVHISKNTIAKSSTSYVTTKCIKAQVEEENC